MLALERVMKKRIAILLVLLALATGAWAARFTTHRYPVGAGVWYPADAMVLREAVNQYINQAPSANLPGPVTALIVPNTSYTVGGAMTGAAIRNIYPGQFDRVILLAPATYARFEGCSIPATQYFRTPMGDVELDGPAIRRLERASAYIDVRGIVYRDQGFTKTKRVALHEREFAIEAVLPFLQVRLGDKPGAFKIIPIVVGSLDDERDRIDEGHVDNIAKAIRSVMDDRTLLIVTTGFTRYGTRFDFTPFTADTMISGITELDMEAFKVLQGRSFDAFANYLFESQNPIEGRAALAILTKTLDLPVRGMMLEYNTTARITGKRDLSISYATLAYFDGTRPQPQLTLTTESSDAGLPPIEETTTDDGSESE
jgi:AmmeMemoRadiSam system protein B